MSRMLPKSSIFIILFVVTNSQSIANDDKKLRAFLNKFSVLVLIVIACAILICLACCIFCCCKCRSKRKELESYTNKQLTQVELGESDKVYHYRDTSRDIVLPSYRTSTRGSTPAPQKLTAITSASGDNDSESIEHKFPRPIAVSDETLVEYTTAKQTDTKEDSKHAKHGYNASISVTITSLYHEHQKWELCLLHALNSLLQEEKFTHKSLDDICKKLAPNKMINPHKSIFQTGNYDANVLMMALSEVNVDVQWYDARKANELDVDAFLEPNETMKFIGFILNNPQKAVFGVFSRRHWLAIRRINRSWYNLDSKLDTPQKFKDTNELTEFLVEVLTTNDAELMICRRKRK